MKKLLAALFGTAMMGLPCCAGVHGGSPQVVSNGTSIGLNVSTFGVFDPSIADTPAATRAWMSYSAVNASALYSENNRVITTRLAFSDDAGKTWTDAGVIVNDLTEGQRGSNDITWINEVSTLVYDATADSSARWKIFWQHYPVINGVLQGARGWIAYKASDTPQNLASATEKKLWAGVLYDSANNVAGGTTDSPVGGGPLIGMSQFGLQRCLAMTEPGGLANSSAVFLAWNCLQSAPPPNPPSRIITETDLLVCAQPCTPENPASWVLGGVPLTPLDDLYFGTLRISGQDIFFDGATAYLLVSPVGSAPVPGAYQGCFEFQFIDLANGKILRDLSGHPQIVNQVQGAFGTFNGSCTFGQNVTDAGFAYGQILTFTPNPIFNIFLAGRR